MEEGSVEQKLNGREGAGRTKVWAKSIPGWGNSKMHTAPRWEGYKESRSEWNGDSVCGGRIHQEVREVFRG